jgi:hypothetical protein
MLPRRALPAGRLDAQNMPALLTGFAHHGLVALTAHSEIVEGFSTVSWFLLKVETITKNGDESIVLSAASSVSRCSISFDSLLSDGRARQTRDRLQSRLGAMLNFYAREAA